MEPAVPLGAVVQPGDFCCVPVSGQGGRLIRVGEWLNGNAFSQYQHAELYVGTSDEVLAYCSPPYNIRITIPQPAQFGWVMSAAPGGAKLRPLPCQPAEMPGALWSSGAIALTASQRTDIVTAALSFQGVPYAWDDYFALALHRFGISDPALMRKIATTKSLICSQLVDESYRQGGIQLFNNKRWPGYVTPADLAAVIMAGRKAFAQPS
jgi:hypothetical protein